MRKRLSPEEYDRLFDSLRSLVDQAQEAYLSGSIALARHATANLSFATHLIHSGLNEQDLAIVRN
ncbi:MAG: hypothetical protein QOG04_1197 [Actinomycetota bacterium]|nr:hypothetical protein [Actinomycetota bacterium]